LHRPEDEDQVLLEEMEDRQHLDTLADDISPHPRTRWSRWPLR
jgi:hypothetical protein